MELYNLIPSKYSHDLNWIIRKDYLMYKKYDLIPLALIDDGIVYVILENKLVKEVIRLTQHLINLDIEFYFTIPEITDPSMDISNFPDLIINHYLFSYTQVRFFKAFDKIDFDLIKNMVDWASKFGHFGLIKKNYEIIHKKVNYKDYNWYSSKSEFKYCEEIRQVYEGLYREIQINLVL